MLPGYPAPGRATTQAYPAREASRSDWSIVRPTTEPSGCGRHRPTGHFEAIEGVHRLTEGSVRLEPWITSKLSV